MVTQRIDREQFVLEQRLRRHREQLVMRDLTAKGIADDAVLRAMRAVPRHLFVDERFMPQAYEDAPLPIPCRQTISQPYIVALMSQLLACEPGMQALEIGTGSGYQAAVLREMGLRVYSVECIRELHVRACALFRALGLTDIQVKLGDGTLGWPETGPFDRILVTAAGPKVPLPLIEQLKDPGMLLIPVGLSKKTQRLVRIRKDGGRVIEEAGAAVSFVDLVGEHGWTYS